MQKPPNVDLVVKHSVLVYGVIIAGKQQSYIPTYFNVIIILINNI